MDRLEFAISLARSAGDLGLDYFRSGANLTVTSKGPQDVVSEADLSVERHIRAAIAEAYPDDGLIGEEFGTLAGRSGYTWIVDPIDGTMNFVNAIPVWAVAIACMKQSKMVVGVINDPNASEIFSAEFERGAFLNGRPMTVSPEATVSNGTVAVGISNLSNPVCATRMVDSLLQRGSQFYRNASGAIGLAYVAAGRLLGYCEPHMKPWDCVAGLLLVTEAGGRIREPNWPAMLEGGDQVVAAAPGVYDEILDMASAAFAVEKEVERSTASSPPANNSL